MIRKSRPRLFAVGALMAASISLAAVSPYFRMPVIVLAFTVIYLMIWATFGPGRRCGNCERFRVF